MTLLNTGAFPDTFGSKTSGTSATAALDTMDFRCIRPRGQLTGNMEDHVVELGAHDTFHMPKFSTDETCYTNLPGVLDHEQFEAALESYATLPAADEYLPLSCVFFALAGPSNVA